MLNAFKQALTSTAKPMAIYVVINYTGKLHKRVEINKIPSVFHRCESKGKTESSE